METKTIFILLALGLGAYAMMKPQGKQYLVNGRWVDESELPYLGYQEVPSGSGIWYSQAQINTATVQAGGTLGTNIDPTSQTFNTILTILQGMQGLVPLVSAIVTTATRPQRIQEILNKYTVQTSAYYIPMFPYTQTDLQAMTNDQLTKILNTGAL